MDAASISGSDARIHTAVAARMQASPPPPATPLHLIYDEGFNSDDSAPMTIQLFQPVLREYCLVLLSHIFATRKRRCSTDCPKLYALAVEGKHVVSLSV